MRLAVVGIGVVFESMKTCHLCCGGELMSNQGRRGRESSLGMQNSSSHPSPSFPILPHPGGAVLRMHWNCWRLTTRLLSLGLPFCWVFTVVVLMEVELCGFPVRATWWLPIQLRSHLIPGPLPRVSIGPVCSCLCLC